MAAHYDMTDNVNKQHLLKKSWQQPKAASGQANEHGKHRPIPRAWFVLAGFQQRQSASNFAKQRIGR